MTKLSLFLPWTDDCDRKNPAINKALEQFHTTKFIRIKRKWEVEMKRMRDMSNSDDSDNSECSDKSYIQSEDSSEMSDIELLALPYLSKNRKKRSKKELNEDRAYTDHTNRMSKTQNAYSNGILHSKNVCTKVSRGVVRFPTMSLTNCIIPIEYKNIRCSHTNRPTVDCRSPDLQIIMREKIQNAHFVNRHQK